jgi:hypothetical protein
MVIYYMIMIGFPTIITVTKESLSTTLAISLNNPIAILNTIELGIYMYIYIHVSYYIPILSLLLLIQDPEKSWFDASMITLELFL